MRRYLKVWGIMLRNSLIRELSFKANFILWMIVEVLWFCGQVAFFSIIFGQVDRIVDWSKWEVILLVGTHQMIAQLFQAFFFVNVSNIPELVRTGRLDSLLVLPIDSQFAVSTKQFGLDSVLNAILGAIVVIVALTKLQVTPSLSMIALYLVAICFGVAIHYSIMLTLAAISFWIVRAQGLVYGYFNFSHIALGLIYARLENDRIDLRDHVAGFHDRIKIRGQLLNVTRHLAAHLNVLDRIQRAGRRHRLRNGPTRHRRGLIGHARVARATAHQQRHRN